MLSTMCQAQYNDVLKVKEEARRLGIDLGKESLVVLERNDEISIYETKSRRAFFIIVNDEYRRFVSDAVIAYGETNGFQGTESAWKKNLVGYYSEQLRELKKRGKVKPVSSRLFRLETAQHKNVAPLLTTVWGQDYPYNELCPTSVNQTTHNLTGCVATALSQMMFYHRFPTRGIGRFESGNASGGYVIDFDNQKIDWSRFRTTYPQTKSKGMDYVPVAELMSVNAKAVSSHFDFVNTASNYIAARSILVNHWRYSPACKFLKNHNTVTATSVIREELANRRPVLISGGHHAFICDGHKDGYFHLNLGWRGAANGYYKVLLDDELGDAHFSCELIKELLFDIRPDDIRRDVAKVIDVAVPGTLGNFLSMDEKKHLRKLTLTGSLNGQDVALLRRMMGAADAWQEGCVAISDTERWSGELQELDMENASFVKDSKHPFLRIYATEGRFTWGKKEFSIGFSSTHDFENLLKTPLSHGKGYRFLLHQGKPFVEFYTLSHAVSPFMFHDCQNLRSIKLPKDVKEILGNAFQWCSSLTELSLPSSVKEVESGAFRECYLLTDVKATCMITETRHNLFPFKTTGKYGEREGRFHKGLFEGNNIYTCKGLVIDGKVADGVKYKVVY